MKMTIAIVCVLLVLTVLYLQTCTGIDFTGRSNKFDATAWPRLREGIHSAQYELGKIDEATSCVIAYDSVHKYFLVTNSITTTRNLLCAGFSISTTVKRDFESKAVIKEKQAQYLKKHARQCGL